MQKAVENIIEEAVKKFNLPKQVVELILDSQLRLCRDTIKDCVQDYTVDKLPVIMLPKFGKLIPNQRKYKFAKEFNDKKKLNNMEKNGE